MKVSKIFVLSIILLAMVMGFSLQAQAALQTIGTATYNTSDYNLIYDDDLEITWLDYTSSYADRDSQMSWALGLNGGVVTYNLNAGLSMNWIDVWRLPTVTDTGSAGCNFAFSGTDCGYNVDTSTGELAHLFHDELGNRSYFDESGTYRGDGNWGLQNTGDFQNLQSDFYWSGTEYAANTFDAWYFGTLNGSQGSSSKDLNGYALAVRPGQLAVVPEPMSMILFGTGGVVLAVHRKLRRRRN